MIRAVLAILLVLHGVAHADNPSLVKARRAIEDVRYDDARQLLVEALKRGTSRTDELREIYQLSAATALVLGQSDLAEQYYRRMLALDPAATLAADTSPKLREPFVAAQAYMAAQGRLEVRAVRKGTAIEVSVSDPLGMVVAVSAVIDGSLLPPRPYAGQPVVLEERRAIEEVVILDEHGNTLRAISGEGLAMPVPEERVVIDRPVTSSTPIVRRWSTWAIPAGVLAGVGVGFLVDARLSKDKLDEILANDDMHFFGDAEAARKRWQRGTLISNVSFAVAGAFAVTAAVMAVTRPSARATVTATIGPDRASVVLHGKF